MPGKTLEQQAAEMKQSFLNDGLLDKEQWRQLESLESEDEPNMLEDFANTFFPDALKDIANIQELLEADQVDFAQGNYWFNKLRGSSSTFGLATVAAKARKSEDLSVQQNLEGMKSSLIELKEEVETMKGKLEAYFELLKEARREK